MGSLLIWVLLLLFTHRPSHSLQYGWSIASQPPPRHTSSPQVGLVPKSVPSFSFSLLTGWGEIPATNSHGYNRPSDTLAQLLLYPRAGASHPVTLRVTPVTCFYLKERSRNPSLFCFLLLIFPQFWDYWQIGYLTPWLNRAQQRAANFHTYFSSPLL